MEVPQRKEKTRGGGVHKQFTKEKRKEKFKKFIGNKYEGQGFADKRKKKIQYEYRKMLHKEKKNAAANDAGSKEADIHKFDGKKQFRKPRGQVKGQSAFSKAAEESRLKKQRKHQKKEEFLKKKREQEESLQAYQQRKKENFKKICKKTHKGQPIMKNQIEYLLQKIEKQVNQT